METYQARHVYLDNIRNILVFNVVFIHIVSMFTYPLTFWWPVIDKNGSSSIYEILLVVMGIYPMPYLIFIAAFFIFYSMKTKSTLGYIKKRFFRLFIPLIVFIFCAGDFPYPIQIKRLDGTFPSYPTIFFNYWRDFIDFSVITFIGEGKMLNETSFNMLHTWFLSFLFFMTLLIVLLAIPFRRKEKVQEEVDIRKKIILKTINLAVILSLFYTMLIGFFVIKGIPFDAWIRVFGLLQVRLDQFFILLPLFLFGLYMYRNNWLTRGDIGSWKMWGIISVVLIVVYVMIFRSGLLPTLHEISKVAEHNMTFSDKMPVPIITDSVERSYKIYTIPDGIDLLKRHLKDSFGRSFLICTILYPQICVFLLMFFLSFAKRFFNKPNKITEFCSKHSINVYVLHFIPVLILQYIFMDIPVSPIIKIVLMIIIIIPACLWLSHRLVYPHPLIVISIFVILKLVSLFIGFDFYFKVLLGLLFISFAGALYESVRLLVSIKTGRQGGW